MGCCIAIAYLIASLRRLLGLRTQADYKAEDIEPEDLDAELIRDADTLRLYFSKVLK